jgi:hypothetical protein
MGILNLNRKYKISFEGLEFDVNIPTPGQQAEIDIRVAKWLNGAKIESFPATTYDYLYTIETLNTVITSYPPELSKMKSWSEIDDFEFLDGVFEQYLEKKKLFDEELKKNRDIRRALANRNASGSVSNETLSHLPKGSEQPIRSGNQTENIPSGSGLDTGRGEIETKNSVLQTHSNSGNEASEPIHSRINKESPSYGRVL